MVHRHEDSSLTARVWVDGQLLRPDCVACTRRATLRYVEAALVDIRGEDRLVLRVQGVGGLRAFPHQQTARALSWLAEQLPLDAREEAEVEAAHAGTRRIARSPTMTNDGAEPKAS